MATALTIAGSDSSGGAGIQADIKTLTANHVFAMSAVTALTAQNTVEITAVMEVTPEFLAAQLDSVFTDIFPDAVKIGMIPSAGLARVIADKLSEYKAQNIVLDPVMIASSGRELMDGDTVSVLKKRLLPLADIITPNIPEAEKLSGISIGCKDDMVSAGKKILTEYGCNVLVKGGHMADGADDLLCTGQGLTWFSGARINNPNTHGTGCTLSSAIAANLAKGLELQISVSRAKAYLTGALSAQLDLGKGSGPMDHAFEIPL